MSAPLSTSSIAHRLQCLGSLCVFLGKKSNERGLTERQSVILTGRKHWPCLPDWCLLIHHQCAFLYTTIHSAAHWLHRASSCFLLQSTMGEAISVLLVSADWSWTEGEGREQKRWSEGRGDCWLWMMVTMVTNLLLVFKRHDLLFSSLHHTRFTLESNLPYFNMLYLILIRLQMPQIMPLKQYKQTRNYSLMSFH